MRKISKYRKQKRDDKDLAFVVIDGQRKYLGEYGTPASKRAYHSIMAEYNATGVAGDSKTEELMMCELCALFMEHAEQYYRKADGKSTSEVAIFRQAVNKLLFLYKNLLINSFGPKKLKAVRQIMIEDGLSRSYINTTTRRIKQIFRWGMGNELVKPDTLVALTGVAGLRKGRSDARETNPIGQVPDASIEAIEPHVSRQIWAVIQLQLYTAARGGELLTMRANEIDMSGKVWLYTPFDHKTSYRDKERVIYIGPKGQDVIREFLSERPVGSCLFSPREALKELKRKGKKGRRENQKPNEPKTIRTIGEYYSPGSYRKAIQRACDVAKVPKWHPHQLRHNAGTNIRKEFGIEAAQVMLGHSELDTTQIYAEVNKGKALLIASKIG